MKGLLITGKKGRNHIHSEWTLMQAFSAADGSMRIDVADQHSDDALRLVFGKEEVQDLLKRILWPNTLHQAFRDWPNLHQRLTEILLTFDTEAGGVTMGLTSATEQQKEATNAY